MKNVRQGFVDVWKKTHGQLVPSSILGYGKTTIGTITNGLVGIAQNQSTLLDLYKSSTTTNISTYAQETLKIADITWDMAYADLKNMK
jgi:hypothetical protein